MTRSRIRPASLDDARPIAEVGYSAWDAAYRGLLPDELIESWSIPVRIERLTERWQHHDPEYRLWVLDGADGLVAYSASGLVHEHESIPLAVAEIYSFYVHPLCWRRGHGRRLMQHVLADLFARGFREVRLWALTDNAPACRFYEALGFLAARERVSKQLDHVDVDQTLYRRMDSGDNDDDREPRPAPPRRRRTKRPVRPPRATKVTQGHSAVRWSAEGSAKRGLIASRRTA